MTSPPLVEEGCPSCGGVIDARYCEICGERRPSERAYTLGAFVHEVFEVFTNVERSFLRSVWTLLRRPGELTAAYMRGERVRYLKPFQLFLLLNVIFFFTAGYGVNMFATPLETHLTAGPYQSEARLLVQELRPTTGMFMADYQRAFDRRGQVLARTLIVAMIPAFAIGIGLLSLNRSRSAVKAVVFSAHAMGVLLLMTVAVVWLVTLGFAVWMRVGGQTPSSDAPADAVGSALLAITFFVWIYVALRRAYGDGRKAALAKALLTIPLFMWVLVLYRMLLFYVTVYTL